MTPAPQPSWLATPRYSRDCRMRLFCFPFAGGGAAAYIPWRPLLEPYGIDVYIVQLPGREIRIAEPCLRSMKDLVSPICDALQPYHGAPFSFFGHSMGALTAFEVTRELARRGHPLPEWLLVSGAVAPHRRKDGCLHLLPQEKFLATVAERYHGLSPEVLANRELVDLLAPVLQADFELVETYRSEHVAPLPVKIAAFGGSCDEWAPVEELGHWRDHTSHPALFRVTAFEGDHFFLIASRGQVTRSIAALWSAGSRGIISSANRK